MGADPKPRANTSQQVVFGNVLNTVRALVKARDVAERDGFDLTATCLPADKCTRLIVTGQGGTGKSFVAHLAAELTRALGRSEGAACLAAPTGVAASLRHGSTIHSLLGLMGAAGDNGNLVELTGEKKTRLQDATCDLVTLWINAFSMLSPADLGKVSARLQEGCKHKFPGAGLLPLGGVPVMILSGDFGQLPPVMAQPHFEAAKTAQESSREKNGGMAMEEALYCRSAFTEAAYLDEQVRAKGGPCSGCCDHAPGDSCVKLRELLHQMRYGSLQGQDGQAAYGMLVARHLDSTGSNFPGQQKPTLSQ